MNVKKCNTWKTEGEYIGKFIKKKGQGGGKEKNKKEKGTKLSGETRRGPEWFVREVIWSKVFIHLPQSLAQGLC
jgi:hypothetical protein